jgi:hypothetical protein
MLMELLSKAATVAMLSFVVSSLLAMGAGLTVSQISEPLRNARLVLMPFGELALAKVLWLDALTAPFAFLGPEYDAALTDVYTNIDPSKVFKKRFPPLAALMQDAMANTSPLFGTISHYINEEMLAKIAAGTTRKDDCC